MTNDPTRRLPIYARPCAACGRLVLWDGRNGYREVVATDAAPWPTGRRRCYGGRWSALVIQGHDPDPQPSEGRWFLAYVALAAAILGLALAALFAVS